MSRDREARSLFERGENVARQLLAENERLRALIAERQLASREPIEGRDARLPEQLQDAVATLEEERRAACDALSSAEAENRKLAQECADLETEYDMLGGLYVAAHQLHSALDLEAVYRTVVEVALNLVGAESLAVYEYDARRARLIARAAEGHALSRLPEFELGAGIVGRAVESGEIHVREGAKDGDLHEPVICIPFRRDEEPVGAIAIYKLLDQKDQLNELDHELFGLLAGHAATAIFSARLYSASKRKLDTMNGFLEMIRT